MKTVQEAYGGEDYTIYPCKCGCDLGVYVFLNYDDCYDYKTEQNLGYSPIKTLYNGDYLIVSACDSIESPLNRKDLIIPKYHGFFEVRGSFNWVGLLSLSTKKLFAPAGSASIEFEKRVFKKWENYNKSCDKEMSGLTYYRDPI